MLSLSTSVPSARTNDPAAPGNHAARISTVKSHKLHDMRASSREHERKYRTIVSEDTKEHT
eukprot:17735-Eustigmatos_ZCMA.PRE.1